MNVCQSCYNFNIDLDNFLEEDTTSSMIVVEDSYCEVCNSYEAEEDDDE